MKIVANRADRRFAMPGFSLIEVLIASALVAVLGLALFDQLTRAIRSKDKIDEVSDQLQVARQAMERMANEISMAYLSGQANLGNPVVATAFKGEKDKIVFSGFGHVSHTKNAKQSDQREVSYFLGEDERTKSPALLRKIHPNLTLKAGTEGTVDTLCSGVKSLRFQYWDGELKKFVENWDTEGSAQKKTLPNFVQIELVVIMNDKVEQKFLTTAEIWLAKPIKI